MEPAHTELPGDAVGLLLQLLDCPQTLRSLRCSSVAWRGAVDRQLRVLRPLHLPEVVGDEAAAGCAGSNSISALFACAHEVQLPFARAVPAPAHWAARGQGSSRLPWLHPLRGSMAALCSAAPNAVTVDLRGQRLPPGSLGTLSTRLPRLRALVLDGCEVARPCVLDMAARATRLTRLSLARVELVGELQQQPPGGPSAAPESTEAQQQDDAALLDAVLGMRSLASLDLSLAAPRDAAGFQHAGLPLRGHGSKLHRLRGSLASLRLLHNPFDASDWRYVCGLSLLTELACSWAMQDDSLELSPDAFASIQQLQQLRGLTLHMQQDADRARVFDAYTLAPVAPTLTSLALLGTRCLSLALSVLQCTSLQQLVCTGLGGPAASYELLAQFVLGLPHLRRLHVAGSVGSEHFSVAHAADELLGQLHACCPRLEHLALPDSPVTGTGLRLAAAAGASSAPSALRQLQHLELCSTDMLRSALPHLSALTGLQSLVLHGMPTRQFTHDCRLDCFQGLASLAQLTRLAISPFTPHTSSAYAGPEGPAAEHGAPGAVQWGWEQGYEHALSSDEDDDGGGVEGDDDELGAFDSEQDASGSSSGPEEDSEEEDEGDSGSGEGWEEEDEEQAHVGGGAHAGSAAAAPRGGDGGSEDMRDSGEEQDTDPPAGDGGGGGAPPAAAAAAGAAAADAQHHHHHQPPLQQHAQAAARPLVMQEALLHFLSGMTSLVELDLSSLSTTGVGLAHLAGLHRLRSLTLGGKVQLTEQGRVQLAALRLPSVQHLNLNCRPVCTAPLPDHHRRRRGQLDPSAWSPDEHSMEALVPLLVAAFPGLQTLVLHHADDLGFHGIAALLRGLPQLQRLRLLGLPEMTHSEPASATHRLLLSHFQPAQGSASLDEDALLRGTLLPLRKSGQFSPWTAPRWWLHELAVLLERGVCLDEQAAAAAARAGDAHAMCASASSGSSKQARQRKRSSSGPAGAPGARAQPRRPLGERALVLPLVLPGSQLKHVDLVAFWQGGVVQTQLARCGGRLRNAAR